MGRLFKEGDIDIGDIGMDRPLVDIIIPAYNHAPYIGEAIESVLMQLTNFPLQILIGDDCSKDGTTQIVLEYQRRFPGIIKLLSSNKNIGMNNNNCRLINACVGKYIAVCEGDDYWIDRYKLNKQVNILEEHPEISLVFTARQVVDDTGYIKREERYQKKIYTTRDVIEGFIPSTQTIVMRNYQNLADFFNKNIMHPSGDRLVAYFCSLMGDLYYLDQITAVYRESGKGVWSSYDSQTKESLFYERFIEFHRILGLEDSYLIISSIGVNSCISCIKNMIRHPRYILKGFYNCYKKYIKGIPLCLLILAIMKKIKKFL